MINFQHDPLACAIALGGEGVETEEIPLMLEEKEGWLIKRIDKQGKPTRVVTRIDGEALSQYRIDRVPNK